MRAMKGAVWFGAAVCLMMAGQLRAQEVSFPPKNITWEADVIGGWFSGDTLWHQNTTGSPWDDKARSDDGWLTGICFSGETEYVGLELTAAGVFQDMDVESQNSAYNSYDEFNMFLGTLDMLVYPTGNALGEGRVKPYLTAGPGLAVTDSDFSEVDGNTLFDFNVGGGIKVFLGNDENIVLRVGWRWHYMAGSSDMESEMFNQELSAGLGIRF